MQLALDDSCLEMIVFRVGSLVCGLPMDEIQEIIRIPPMSPVRIPQREVAGLINLRGKIVTVLDLRVRCDVDNRESSPDMRIIALNYQHELVGLMVNAVEDSVFANPEEILPVPANLEGIQAEMFKAVYKSDDQLIGIVDLPKILFREAA